MLNKFIRFLFELIIICMNKLARALVFFVIVDICYDYSMLDGSTEFVMICMGGSIESN